MIHIPHLESDITTACQLSCVGCNHMVPLWRSTGVWKSNPQQVEKDLNHLATIVHADRWGALGGEPTLSKDLVPVLKIVRDSGICDQIEVWTNGILPAKWCRSKNDRPDFWCAEWDILVVSRYKGKLTDEDVATLKSYCRSVGKQIEIKDERTWHNFRTNLEAVPTGPEATKAKYDSCFFKQFSRVVNNGYFYTCCCSPHMPRLLQGRPEGSDGIAIEGLTEDALQAYLTRVEPLGCCTICAGRDTAKPVEWGEEKDPARWLEASSGRIFL